MRRGKYVAVSFALGFAAGAVVWGSQMHRFKRDLFSANPVRRLAALGYLSAIPGSASSSLLREYVAWEQNPTLRRRGVRMLRRLEQHRAA